MRRQTDAKKMGEVKALLGWSKKGRDEVSLEQYVKYMRMLLIDLDDVVVDELMELEIDGGGIKSLNI